ncbi:MAG: hypothetical protein EA382_10520 [Spirochaetaceae bacterium]|nr:MAG: hypothetical protein EA382_10520 [Spirochaetaceae bacterium]
MPPPVKRMAQGARMYRLVALDIATFPTRTRMPFRYGIARLTAMPHAFLRATLEVSPGGTLVHGVAAEGLLPRWFEKDPTAPFQQDLDRIWAVIQEAGRRALGYGQFADPFHFWSDLYADQLSWGDSHGYAPLLAHFGLTLVERAVLDAVSRSHSRPLSTLLADGTIAVDRSRISDPPSVESLAAVTGATPLSGVHARHTVGMADPLTRADVPEPIHDGLPETLEEDIARYGLTHFKIKVQGDVSKDIPRLEAVRDIITGAGVGDYRFTLDGNETFLDVATFRGFWDAVRSSAGLRDFFGHLIFIEQPFKREIALSGEVGDALRSWPDAPPIIIDESDGSLGDLPLALANGFRGTSHKNCKGVFKGIINAARIADYRRAEPDKGYVMSAEDLVNIGPVALLQDLAMVAKLGITHVERNGHHYFRGLSMFPEAIGRSTLAAHGDLYESPSGYAELKVRKGRLDLHSVNTAPFGVAFVPEADYRPLAEWERPVAPEDTQ